MTHPALTVADPYLTPNTANGSHPEPDDYLLRVSSVGQADLCMGRLHHQNHPNYDDEKGEVLVFGTVQHALIEQQVLTSQVVGRAQAEAAAAEVFAAEGVTADLLGITAMGPWLDEQVMLANRWRQWCRGSLGWPLPEPAFAEVRMAHPFMAAPDGRRVWLAGTPDLLLPSMGLGVDWKTANKGWPPARAQSQNQQYAYRYLAQRVLGIDLDRWLFVVANRAKGEWEQFEVSIERSGIEGYLTRAQAVVDSLLAGTVVYHPKSGTSGRRGWWCSSMYCSAWSVCGARLLGDGQDGEGDR